MNAANVVVEVIGIRPLPDGALGYRVVHALWEPGTTPDRLALDAIGIAETPGPWTVSHSTSWRFEEPDVVYLTYAVMPDLVMSADVTILERTGVVSSGDPMLPTPPELHEHHIAAHAVRHLAYLVETDPAVRDAAGRWPRAWQPISTYAASVPVGTHGEVHALAEAADRRRPAARPQ